MTLSTLTFAGIGWSWNGSVLLARNGADLCSVGVEIEEWHDLWSEEVGTGDEKVGWIWLGFGRKNDGLWEVVLECEVGEG